MFCRLIAALALLGSAAFIRPEPGLSAGAAACRPARLTLSAWTIPHTNPSWGIGTKNSWPVAVDGDRALMAHQITHAPTWPQPISMALAVFGRPRLRPIPPGAYPHFGVLQRWQIAWPWIVGVVDRQPLPGPIDWQLWAGNVVTGRHIILDHGNNADTADSTAVMRGFPDFDLAQGRVVWTWNAYHLHRAGWGRFRIAFDDLTTRRRSFLPLQASPIYSNPTIWGDRVVWEHVTRFACRDLCPHEIIDQQLYDIRTHRLSALTHSTFRTGNSFAPGLWENDLVFLHGNGSGPASGGRVTSVDLSTRVPGRHPSWWQAYRHRSFTRGTVIALMVRDGLAAWDGGVAELATGLTHALPMGADQETGGHALVMQANAQGPYEIVRVSSRCDGH
jgi:hypothetical protein